MNYYWFSNMKSILLRNLTLCRISLLEAEQRKNSKRMPAAVEQPTSNENLLQVCRNLRNIALLFITISLYIRKFLN